MPTDRAGSRTVGPAATTIHVSGVVLAASAREIWTVRKRGTGRFMLPGGKPEPGESAAEAAVRECAEELGVALDPAALREIGVFRARAANEVGFDVEATVFEHPASAVGEPAAEIEELRPLDLLVDPLPDDLAPLLADHVVPILRSRRS